MIVSDLFNDKSTGNNPAITTELKLKSLFSKLYELPDNKTYPFKQLKHIFSFEHCLQLLSA